MHALSPELGVVARIHIRNEHRLFVKQGVHSWRINFHLHMKEVHLVINTNL